MVFTGGEGSWKEIGRTEKRLNEWNPKFAKSIQLPADNDNQRKTQIRVDFYNKEVTETRFLGTCELNFFTLIHAQGKEVEFELKTPEAVRGSPRVFLAALEGYGATAEPSSVHLSFQLMQTNYYGVSMRLFYEICRAGSGTWHPVFKSEHIMIDEQGWGQFPTSKISMQELAMDEESTGLLVNVYRYKRLGTKKLLGHFQFSVTELVRKQVGDFMQFTANPKEDIVCADLEVTHTQKNGLIYDFGLKLINVQWRATLLTPENTK